MAGPVAVILLPHDLRGRVGALFLLQTVPEPAGKKIVTTAVARKLLTRAWHLLTDAESIASPQPAAPHTAAP